MYILDASTASVNAQQEDTARLYLYREIYQVFFLKQIVVKTRENRLAFLFSPCLTPVAYSSHIGYKKQVLSLQSFLKSSWPHIRTKKTNL